MMTTDFSNSPKLRPMWQTPCYAKLCDLGWAHGFSVICYGVRIALRSNSAELLDRLRDALPNGCKPYRGAIVDHVFSAILGGREEGSRVRKMHMLYGNHDLIFRHRELEPMFPAFDSAFRLAVAALAPRRVFVHAGVVAWQGRAILLPGRSMTGKTTLVAELLRAGASYLSDEYAVLDSAGCVHPFNKPLAIRAGEGVEQVDLRPEALGGKVVKRSMPVGLVVLSQYKEGGRWRPRTMTPGHGALELFSHTTTAWYAPRRSMATLREVAAAAPIVRSARGEAAEVAPAILRLLERSLEHGRKGWTGGKTGEMRSASPGGLAAKERASAA